MLLVLTRPIRIRSHSNLTPDKLNDATRSWSAHGQIPGRRTSDAFYYSSLTQLSKVVMGRSMTGVSMLRSISIILAFSAALAAHDMSHACSTRAFESLEGYAGNIHNPRTARSTDVMLPMNIFLRFAMVLPGRRSTCSNIKEIYLS